MRSEAELLGSVDFQHWAATYLCGGGSARFSEEKTNLLRSCMCGIVLKVSGCDRTNRRYGIESKSGLMQQICLNSLGYGATRKN